jgi:hypothetical protein
MKVAVLIFLLGFSFVAAAAPEPFIKCLSSSSHVKAIDIYMVNFKDMQDEYTGVMPECSFVPSKSESSVMEIRYPAKGSTLTGSDGKLLTFWTAAVVVDENNKPTIFYQYSDFISRSITLQAPTPCTQGLFISDTKQVLDFKANEPSYGKGLAEISGEKVLLSCQLK